MAQVSASSNSIYTLSNDTEFAFVLEEALSLSNNFGANTGEILRAASQIVPGDYESWYREFNFLANTIHDRATNISAHRFPVSAREAYLRSATYYRMADFFLVGNVSDPRVYDLWDAALADFDSALELWPTPAKRYNITAGNFTVPVIFYSPAGSSIVAKKLPTIIAGTGYDGSQEELWHTIGRSAVDRGFNFVTYEGPGQPTVRRQQDLGFIPNWWDVVTPVVDFVSRRQDVDMDQLALIGVSFGGSLAPIAAAHEPRFSAILAIDGLVDIQKSILDSLPPQFVAPFEAGDQSKFDDIMLGLAANTSTPTQLRWLIQQSLFAFNTNSPFEWMTQLVSYTAYAPVLNNIHVPFFVGEGQNDSSGPGQAQKMANILGNYSTYNLFKTDIGAGEHCQIGAEAQLAQVSLDWLSDVFANQCVPGKLTSVVI